MYYMILSSKKMASSKKLAEIIAVPYNIPLEGAPKTKNHARLDIFLVNNRRFTRQFLVYG